MRVDFANKTVAGFNYEFLRGLSRRCPCMEDPKTSARQHKSPDGASGTLPWPFSNRGDSTTPFATTSPTSSDSAHYWPTLAVLHRQKQIYLAGLAPRGSTLKELPK